MKYKTFTLKRTYEADVRPPRKGEGIEWITMPKARWSGFICEDVCKDPIGGSHRFNLKTNVADYETALNSSMKYIDELINTIKDKYDVDEKTAIKLIKAKNHEQIITALTMYNRQQRRTK